MNPHYNQNYSHEEIKDILSKIKECISTGKYTISLNERRQENIDFINEYNIRSDRQKSILMQIEVEDFCHSLQNTKCFMFLFRKFSFSMLMAKKKLLMYIRSLIFSIFLLEAERLSFHSISGISRLIICLDNII